MTAELARALGGVATELGKLIWAIVWDVTGWTVQLIGLAFYSGMLVALLYRAF